jgi:hypothetical protein
LGRGGNIARQFIADHLPDRGTWLKPGNPSLIDGGGAAFVVPVD